ncbi:MAG: hypothetical protein ACE5LU_23500, partial [Anaerolineae bacterium]
MFLKNAPWNTSGNFVRQMAAAVREFGSRPLLPPAVLGVWEFPNLIRRVGNILDMGFLSAAQRDLPVLRGAGKTQEESEYGSTTFITHLASKIVIATGVLVYGVLFWHRYSVAERAAFIAAKGGKLSIVGEPLQFFRQNRWWWLTPMVLILLLF